MRSSTLFRPAQGWLLAALLTTSATALAYEVDSPELWAAVPDAELSQMRGGLDLGFLVANFAIERAVRVNGEIVSLTRLVLTDLPRMLAGGAPSVQLSGNLANLIQVGQGNGSPEAINAATQAAVAETLAAVAPSVQANPAPPNPNAPGNSGTASTANAANLQGPFGDGLAYAVALANGDAGLQPPAPAPTPTAPAVPGSSSGAPAATPAPTAPAGHAAAPGLGTSGPAAAPSAGAAPAPGARPQAPNPPAGSWQAATSQSASAAAGAAQGATAPLTSSLSIPIGNTGQVINVTSIPNAAAFATSIQNSVQATRIDTETSISATLSSLGALRSSIFAASVRQQAIDSVRR